MHGLNNLRIGSLLTNSSNLPLSVDLAIAGAISLQLIENAQALDYFSDDIVVTIEVRGSVESDQEFTTIRVGTIVDHSDDSTPGMALEQVLIGDTSHGSTEVFFAIHGLDWETAALNTVARHAVSKLGSCIAAIRLGESVEEGSKVVSDFR